MKILGIDEAGRGPVIGSLHMCGYLIDEKNVYKLKELGVKDSKLLSKKKREEMFKELKVIADDFIVLKANAKKIDKTRDDSNLNQLEIDQMRELIELLKPDKVIIDAIERNTKKFKEKIGIKSGIEVIAENFADKNHIEVGAASICAKVSRDNEVERLHKKVGYFGSGYPADPATITFLKDCIKKNTVPDCVRKSWFTYQLMVNEKKQTNLSDW